MVLLPNTGELTTRYAPYIQDLQEFFALHDLRCGSPRELGFLAARLSGRDSFPGELASMVRSFIFREGGSVPLPDLLTVVALAVGGSAVAEYAPGLQHPLADISAFLASVARAPLDQPPPALASDESEAAEALPSLSQASAPSTAAPAQPFAEPSDPATPFLPPLSSDAALAPATLAHPRLKPNQPAAIRRVAADPAAKRGLSVALAVALPVLLLAALLFHRFNPPADAHVSSSANPAPKTNVPASALSPASISTPLVTPQTPLATAAVALAQPNFSSSLRPTAQPSLTRDSYPTSAASPADVAVTASLRTPNSAPAPALPAAVSSAPKPTETPVPPPHAAAPRPATNSTSVSVTTQQTAFGISSGIMSSHLFSFSPPKYPKMAGLTHAEGQVILQAVVSKTGRVSTVKAITGPHTLRKAAEKAVKQWRYRPYITDGHPADVATIITIDVRSPH